MRGWMNGCQCKRNMRWQLFLFCAAGAIDLPSPGCGAVALRAACAGIHIRGLTWGDAAAWPPALCCITFSQGTARPSP